jgi:hypothetical protein
MVNASREFLVPTSPAKTGSSGSWKGFDFTGAANPAFSQEPGPFLGLYFLDRDYPYEDCAAELPERRAAHTELAVATKSS